MQTDLDLNGHRLLNEGKHRHLSPFTPQTKWVQTASKKYYQPVILVKEYWSFRQAIGTYGPAETAVFLYKSYGSIPLF